MSKITLEPNNSGTGTFTIAAPNSNTNRTLTLPDEAGTALTDATDLEPQVKTSLNATGDAPLFACRAFVNFDGRGTVFIRESGNVSSITDNGTGFYTINFTNAMPDAGYSVTGSATRNNNSNSQAAGTIFSARAYSSSSFNVTFFKGDAFYDPPTASFSVFR